MNEPELDAGINPGMAFDPVPSSILDKTRQDSNPQPLDESLTTRPYMRPSKNVPYILAYKSRNFGQFLTNIFSIRLIRGSEMSLPIFALIDYFPLIYRF
jgi:hypothetical protein